ncbi:MAG: LPS export ABC transporter periplasmic protein LptC [Candidatus Azobacteroides sp.]|nr:LPS export ABC transporter periplasmic protein LptC [Candidatus Azobacteroides sp.]
MKIYRKNKIFYSHKSLFFLLFTFFTLPNAFFSCSEKNESTITLSNSDSLARMTTYGVTSLISDSGVIRYKIMTDEWLIFDKVKEPYWYFPQGLYVEQFDSTLHPDAHILCDTAYFYEQQQLWKLIGNVHLENLQGEKFDTQELYWDQKKEKIYSDKFIQIEQKDRIITGIGFDSNQSITIYTIRKPQGIFTLEEKDEIEKEEEKEVVSEVIGDQEVTKDTLTTNIKE